MKILFQHPLPFAWAHGGFQVQIEQTKAALERRGLQVEYVRWWDEAQTGDLVHHFGAPSSSYLRMASARGLPSVVTHLFSEACNRPRIEWWVRGAVVRAFLSVPTVKDQLNAQAFRRADRMVVGLEAERLVLQRVFGVRPERIVQVPLGLQDDFLRAGSSARTGNCLITTGTINEVKRSIDLACLAREARTPLLFVGKPYRPDDSYWKEFSKLIDGEFVLHRDHIADRSELIDLLKNSRGFVIYSRYENWCLSAHEAAACGLPLLLPDLPWSRECFGPQASYLHPRNTRANVARLRDFYERCPTLPGPSLRLYSWDDVAGMLVTLYKNLARS